MTPNELRKLLAQDENPKLEFKSKFYEVDHPVKRVQEIHSDELIKDILALTNGNTEHTNEDGYLIIGVDSKFNTDGTRDLHDVGAVTIERSQIIGKVNSACHPPLQDLQCKKVEFDGHIIWVIIIPRSPFLHHTTRELGEHKEYPKNTVFVRRGESIGTATPEEIQEITLAKKRYSSPNPISVGSIPNPSLEFITDPEVLLAKLYDEEHNDDPLAHHHFPYQLRDPERDIQRELRSALNQTRYLLITGRSGLGKTREAAILARSLMLEGYRVIRVEPGLLQPPREFPPELGENRRRILVFIDDLHSRFGDEEPESSKADESAKPNLQSYHDRLLATIDWYEKRCFESEIRVIATARDDTDSWRVLNFNPRDRLWKRFTQFELPEPKNSAVEDLLNAELASGNVQGEKSDFAAIARENDGTFANVVQNLIRVRDMKQSLTLGNYVPTLDGSWRDVYERAVAKHPAVSYTYDAINLIKQVDVELYLWIVEPTACLLWKGKRQEKATRERKIKRALKYLTQEKILAESEEKLVPRDGQIEAKGQKKVDWKQYSSHLRRILLRLAKKDGEACLPSLFGFSSKLYLTDQVNEAEPLLRRIIELLPQYSNAWSDLGAALTQLERWEEAGSALQTAIKCDPNNWYAHFHDGDYFSKLERYPEAEEEFRYAVACDPSVAVSHWSMGYTLELLDRYEESEAEYHRAIELEPNDFDYHHDLSFLLWKMRRFSEAEKILHRAIQLKLNQTEHTFTELVSLADYCRMVNYSADLEELVQRARALVADDDWMNLARLESVCGNLDLSLDHLLRASEQEDFDPVQVSKDPTLVWIRDHPRFSEIVVMPTETESDEDDMEDQDE